MFIETTYDISTAINLLFFEKHQLLMSIIAFGITIFSKLVDENAYSDIVSNDSGSSIDESEEQYSKQLFPIETK